MRLVRVVYPFVIYSFEELECRSGITACFFDLSSPVFSTANSCSGLGASMCKC